MKTLLVTAACIGLLPLTTLSQAKRGFETVNLVLYQPDPILRERVSSIEALSDYIKRLEAVCTDFFADETKPESLNVVIAIRPGSRSKVWFVSSARPQGDNELAPLREKLEAIEPPEVQNGPVAVAISATVAGGELKAPDQKESSGPPIPREWELAAGKLGRPAVVPDDILNIVWPDDTEPSVPEGVRYIKASTAMNEKASALLRAGLTAQPYGLAKLKNKNPESPLLVGPFLTGELTQTSLVESSRFTGGGYSVKLSEAKGVTALMPGIAATNADQRSALDVALAKWLPSGPEVRIRKLTAKELALIWYFIAWDVSEPIFVVESGGRTLIADFDDAGESIFWLEDISTPCFRVVWQGGSLKPCYCSVVSQEGNKYSVGFEPRAVESTCAVARTEKPVKMK